MATAGGLVLGAGGVAFLGSFKEAGGFPSNGYAIIAGTTALTFLASVTDKGPLSGPVKALAALMLLVAILRYVPGLRKSTSLKMKGKRNG